MKVRINSYKTALVTVIAIVSLVVCLGRVDGFDQDEAESKGNE
jgi:hypothetical protein